MASRETEKQYYGIKSSKAGEVLDIITRGKNWHFVHISVNSAFLICRFLKSIKINHILFNLSKNPDDKCIRPAVTEFLVLQGSHSPGSELYGSVGYSTGYAHMNFGGAQQSWRGSQPQL